MGGKSTRSQSSSSCASAGIFEEHSLSLVDDLDAADTSLDTHASHSPPPRHHTEQEAVAEATSDSPVEGEVKETSPETKCCSPVHGTFHEQSTMNKSLLDVHARYMGTLLMDSSVQSASQGCRQSNQVLVS